MFGFYNVVARVDATQKSFALKVISDAVLRKTLGGKGLATHLLLSYNSPNVNALDPKNHLVIATGPATGTGISGSCHHGIFTKSPQTGYYSEHYEGGAVADHIASTGFDALIIHGASQQPVWLEASEETIGFHPADNLRGLNTHETEKRIKAWIKDHRPAAASCGVVAIGPADENDATPAVMPNDHKRPAGRTGIGSVMGSKKIKAIVFWGNRQKEFADPRLVQHLASDLAPRAKNDANEAASTLTPTPAWGVGAGFKSAPPNLSKMIGPERVEGRAEMFAELEDRLTILDSLILCRFHLDRYRWDELAAVIKGITGLELTRETMRSLAGGIADDARRFNLWEGLTPEEDRLSELLSAEVLEATGGSVSEEQTQQLLNEYYKARGWDDMGRPA